MDLELNLMTESVDHAGPVEPLCVQPTATIREVLLLLPRPPPPPSALVCRDKSLLGVFTERDALRVMAHGINLDSPIEKVMTPQPVTVRAGEKVGVAVQKMATGGYRPFCPSWTTRASPSAWCMFSGIVHYLVEHFPKSIYNLPPVAAPAFAARRSLTAFQSAISLKVRSR